MNTNPNTNVIYLANVPAAQRTCPCGSVLATSRRSSRATFGGCDVTNRATCANCHCAIEAAAPANALDGMQYAAAPAESLRAEYPSDDGDADSVSFLESGGADACALCGAPATEAVKVVNDGADVGCIPVCAACSADLDHHGVTSGVSGGHV